ncbi:hypothetical protein EBN03_27855 [Nocardia stercoris]|uniref:Uncharacterized protein n=1 Tax=Nocardia stercoris TaxID=2483361 RepID=A0A3M2KZI3_9NOCA|nr:hypothetical protein EBN03_27855 [Nocardia stercoris]
MLAPIQNGVAGGESFSPIDEIVCEGARRMLTAPLQAEVAAHIAQHAGQVDGSGHRLIVRNGYHAEGTVLTSAGPSCRRSGSGAARPR